MHFKSAARYLLSAVAVVCHAEAKLGRMLSDRGIFRDPVSNGNGSPSEGVGEVDLDVVFPTIDLDEETTDGEPETAELLYTPDDKYVDKICVDYCDDYFYTYCQHHNIFVNRRRRRRLQKAGEWNQQEEFQRTHGRSLVETEEEGSERGKDYSEAMQDCHETCMIWPRPLDPMEFWNSVGRENYTNTFDALTSNLGGDTFWCRERHMTMTAIFEKAEYNGIGDNFQGGFQSSAAFHCSLANPDGAGICNDSTIGRSGMSPYELQRSKQKSRAHVGYCDIMDNGKIVDCTGQNTIADSNLGIVLGTFPDNMEVLFLNGIEGITHLESNIFQANLKKPDKLKALYINQCNITGALNEPGESPFSGLVNLEVLNLDENRGLNVVNSGLLDGLTKLKQYAMFDASIELLPPDMFDDCKETLEVMTIYCLPGPQDKLGTHGFFDANFFRGMENLVTMSFVFCDFNTDDVEDDSMFDDLKSLKWFDFNGDEGMKTLKNRWFNCNGCGGSKMGEDLVRFAMWGTGLEDCVFDGSYSCGNAETVPGEGDKVFQNLDKLEAAWFYNTYLTVIPELYLDNKKYFEAITIGTPITGQLPSN